MQLSVAKYNSFEKRDVGRRLWWVKEIVQWRGDLLTLAFTLFQPGIGKCSKHQGSVGQRPHAKDGPAKKKKKKKDRWYLSPWWHPWTLDGLPLDYLFCKKINMLVFIVLRAFCYSWIKSFLLYSVSQINF